MEREFACFFTGHRIIAANKRAAAAERTMRAAESLIADKGVTDFITGGARGFDTMAAQIVLRLREKYSHIKLHLYLPCYNQMKNWNARDMYEGNMVIANADSRLYVTKSKYVTGCMQARNKKMARDALYCIAYMNNPRSGTASTLKYAEDMFDVIINVADE